MKIAVVGLGGTIVCTTKNQTAYYGYGKTEKLSIGELLASFRTLDEIPAQVDDCPFGALTSHQATFEDYAALSLKLDKLLEQDGYDGAVVAAGTDTLEETAYFLDLTLRSRKAVVVTGAMRPTSCVPGDASMDARVLGADGPANLYHAILLAAAGKTEGFGVTVLFNDRIYPARDVTKTNSHRTDTFACPVLGALGYVDTDRVSLYRVPVRALRQGDSWQTPFDLSLHLALDEATRPMSVRQRPGHTFSFARVAILPVYHDQEAELLDALAASGQRGIVLMATGLGDIGPRLEAAKARLMAEKGIAFMHATRTGSGTVYPEQLTVPATDVNKPAFAADSLNGYHARLLLTLCLSFTDDVQQMHRWVDTYGRLSL